MPATANENGIAEVGQPRAQRGRFVDYSTGALCCTRIECAMTNTETRTVVRHADGLARCAWCPPDPLYVRYHDDEWGVALHDERRLFETLCLEGAQAGLAWITVLRKRDGYRRAFDDFDAAKVARYTPRRIEALMRDAAIVRNRLKIEAIVGNAKAYLALRDAGKTLDEIVWSFAPRRRRRFRSLAEVPAATSQSDAMSRELRRLGFRFAGTTICYAFMQAVGIVDDHVQQCWVVDQG
jgi:DNA-3-methyladenine glycosylase I